MKKSNNFFSLLIVLFIFLFSSCKNGDLINFYKACANNDVKTCTAILDKKGNVLAEAEVKYLKMDITKIAESADVHEEMCYYAEDDVTEICFEE